MTPKEKRAWVRGLEADAARWRKLKAALQGRHKKIRSVFMFTAKAEYVPGKVVKPEDTAGVMVPIYEWKFRANNMTDLDNIFGKKSPPRKARKVK